MNSREALMGAMALGIDGIELDAQLTADSVLVAYHPADLDELTTCSGKMNAWRWQDLRACATKGAGKPYALVRVDSLLLTASRLHPQADFTLDCKLYAAGDWWEYLHAFSDAVLALDATPALHGRIVVDCKTDDFLGLLTSKRPGFPAFLYVDSPEGAVERAQRLGCAGITMAYDRCDADAITAAHAAGLRVTLFGCSSRWGHRSALKLRPDRLQTDEPGYAVGLRRAAP